MNTVIAPTTAATSGRPRRLSFAQERLWLVEQLGGQEAALRITDCWLLEGEPDLSALQYSLDSLVRRHEILRATYHEDAGAVVQVVSPAAPVVIERLDLRERGWLADSAELRRMLRQLARRPFDLTRDLMLRVALAQLSDLKHVLLVTTHHIACDAWSCGILYRELAEGYDARVDGRTPQLPALSCQYADFAERQRAWLHGEIHARQLEYWKQQLDGSSPVVNLPTDWPADAEAGREPVEAGMEMPQAERKALAAIGYGQGATLFVVLLAAFQLLLSRLSGQRDLCIGAHVANRRDLPSQQLIGLLLNTVVLRARLGRDMIFSELLVHARDVTLGALDHQDMPFERLVAELRPQREADRNPLVDVIINYASLPGPAPQFRGLTCHRLPRVDAHAPFGLTLYVLTDGKNLEFRLVGQGSRYSQARVRCMLLQYVSLLRQISAAPNRPLHEYSLAGVGSLPEPHLPIAESLTEPVTITIGGWAGRNPHGAAIQHAGQTWTYEQLWARSSVLAVQLRELLDAPGEVIAIIGQRSFGLIAAMVAALRARAVMLPLDPWLPLRRLQVMAREAGARIVVIAGEDPEGGFSRLAPRCLRVDPASGRAAAAGRPSLAEPLAPCDPADPAYIFFTSGTTGMPKAVLGWPQPLSPVAARAVRHHGSGPRRPVHQLVVRSGFARRFPAAHQRRGAVSSR